MNESFESRLHEHPEVGSPAATVMLWAGICSVLFGLVAVLTNGVLLFTLYKDPYNFFRPRATMSLVVSLSLSDFIGGAFVQPLYSAYMFSLAAGVDPGKLYRVSLISSHISAKISILTVVALSVDRYLAIKLSWKYRLLITVRKVIVCSALIWLFCGAFEASHSIISGLKEFFHSVDLHLQTTIPLATLCAVYAATYIEFRRYSRNAVFVRASKGGWSRIFVRNVILEKKIVLTVVLIIIVLFISLSPYLIVTNLEEQCKGAENSGLCNNLGFIITKALSIPMLCVSCAANPFLYAWRIRQYRQALRLVCGTTCVRFRRRGRTVGTGTATVIEQNRSYKEPCSKKQEEIFNM